MPPHPPDPKIRLFSVHKPFFLFFIVNKALNLIGGRVPWGATPDYKHVFLYF